jgi:hypothetical protein
VHSILGDLLCSRSEDAVAPRFTPKASTLRDDSVCKVIYLNWKVSSSNLQVLKTLQSFIESPCIMAPSSLSSAPEETPPRPPFLTLPLEIVDLIADNYLTLCDCKSLRLTCHFFEMPMIRPLFRRVVLSKTKLDHDNFFNIASSPTLAAAARELIWYELAEDETVFFAIEEDLTGNPTPTSKGKAPTPIPVSDNGPLPDSVAEKDLDGEDMPHKLPPFSAIARDAFWWTSLGSSQEYRQRDASG